MPAHLGALGSPPQLSGRSSLFGTLWTSKQAMLALFLYGTYFNPTLGPGDLRIFRNFALWKWDLQLSMASGVSQSLS